MADARATAVLISDVSSGSVVFEAVNDTGAVIGTVTETGGFDIVSGTAARLEWNGPDIEITITSPGLAKSLRIKYPAPLSYSGLLVNIPHTAKDLNTNDVVTYTSIKWTQITP